jgi:hypothetical protein
VLLLHALAYVEQGRIVWSLHPVHALLVIPALVMCFFDWMLAARGVPYHPAVTGIISFVLALVLVRNALADSFGNWWIVSVFVLSAIPAAVCSWLSSEKQNGTAA